MICLSGTNSQANAPSPTVLPELYIPGAPKCGTSALASYLADRPDVYLGHVKEPNFWSSDMPSFARREGFDDERSYAAMYRRAPAGTAWCLDASTHYLYSSIAVERILNRTPGARFIVMFRPGPEIAHAWHMQMHIAGYEDEPDFETAWRLIETRARGRRLPPHCPEPKLLDYRSIAWVGAQVERLLKVAGAGRVLVLPLADMRDDPRAVYLRCLDFLGLDDDGRRVFPVENAASENRLKSLSRLVRSPIVRPALNRALALIGPQAAGHSKHWVKRLLYRKQARAPLADTFIDELAHDFQEDHDRLKRIVLGHARCPAGKGAVTGIAVPGDESSAPQHPA